MAFQHGLVGLFALACLGLSPGSARADDDDSQLPDNDSTNFNNDFTTARDLGTLAQPNTGIPIEAVRSGQLGQVVTGFDTLDVYKFRLPPNEYLITITTTEQPGKTSALFVYDEQGNIVGRSIDNAGEKIVLPSNGGTLYVEVSTTQAVANGRLLHYTLTVSPKIQPLPDMAGADCRFVSLSELSNGGERQGSLSGSKWLDAYPVYLPRASQVTILPVYYPKNYTAGLIDRISGEQFTLVRPEPGNPIYQLLDPGFYCLAVSAPYHQQPVNYRVMTTAAGGGHTTKPDKANAAWLTLFDVGNLSRNGHYEQYRQTPEARNPSVGRKLVPARPYVLREWLGPDNWFVFELTDPANVEAVLGNLYNPARMTLENAQGELLAVGTADSISLDDRLPPLNLKQGLAAGVYYLHLQYAGIRSPGTGYELRLTANPP